MLVKRALAPDAVSVVTINNDILRVGFSNGEVRDFNAGKELFARKCYQALNDPALFQTAHIAYGTVMWTDELDIDPEWLYEESVEVRE